MRLEGERLWIIPLSTKELSLFLKNLAAFEEKTAMKYCGEPLEGVLTEIFTAQLEIIKAQPQKLLFRTIWLFVLKDTMRVVGSGSFKNSPGENPLVEIGYGCGEEFRNMGYTTEAVEKMCLWALSQKGVEAVIAEVSRNNIPSQRVLEKCGMRQYIEGEELWYIIEG